jgi:hypothetical protein
MFLVETNVVSGLRARRPHGGVLAWLMHRRPDTL